MYNQIQDDCLVLILIIKHSVHENKILASIEMKNQQTKEIWINLRITTGSTQDRDLVPRYWVGFLEKRHKGSCTN